MAHRHVKRLRLISNRKNQNSEIRRDVGKLETSIIGETRVLEHPEPTMGMECCSFLQKVRSDTCVATLGRLPQRVSPTGPSGVHALL